MRPPTSDAPAVRFGGRPRPGPVGADNEDRTGGRSRRGTAVALAAWSVLVVGSYLGGRWLMDHGYRMRLAAPPLTGRYDPRMTVLVLPAVAWAAAAVALAPRLAHRLAWRRLLLASFAAALGWAAVLALVEGGRGIPGPVRSPADYLFDVPRVGAPGAFLRTFTDRIDAYTVHVRSHPPGMVLLLWLLGRAGAPGPWPAAVLQVVGGAAAAPAVLVAARELAGEGRARAAAPFVAMAPIAVWVATSGDALFAGVGAWAVAAVVVATGRRGAAADRLALAGGVLFGAGLMLSYGLALAGLVPVSAASARRRLRPVALAGAASVAVLALFAVAGFSWLEGLRESHREYLEGVSRNRPYAYFLVANLGAFAVALGPAIAVGLARLRDRGTWLLVGGALAAVAVADVTGLSKGEVERIWLPFGIWVLLAGGALATGLGAARRWLALHLTAAIAVQVAVRSPW